MVRPALCLSALGFVALVFATPAPASAQSPAVALPDWTGIWTRVGSLNLDPTIPMAQPDRPPYNADYAARHQKILDAEAKGLAINDQSANCMPPGVVRMMNMPYPMEILQTKGQVTVIAEWMGQIRRIFTDGRGHPADLDPTYYGHSIGHWEGQTLVVDTVAIRGGGILNDHGSPIGQAPHMIERWRQADANTLKVELTLEDPSAFTKPYTVVKTFRRAPPSLNIMEYVCEENNRNPTRADGSTGVALIGR